MHGSSCTYCNSSCGGNCVFLTYRAQLSKLDNSKGVENSIYSEQFKGKKVMVLVPHEMMICL